MKYYTKKPTMYAAMYGEDYACDHPVYYLCTLYKIDNMGLAVIQQKFNEFEKSTRWTKVDPWLRDMIYLNPGFKDYFNSRAKEKDSNGFYPTVTVRQIMWALRMKPLKRERWETVFDRKDI